MTGEYSENSHGSKLRGRSRLSTCGVGLPAAPLLALLLLAFQYSTPAFAQEGSAAELGRKLSDPLSNVWALFTEIDFTWSEGDYTNGKLRHGQSVVFQPIMPLSLTENINLTLRPTIPVVRTDIPVGRRYNTVPINAETEIVFPDGSAAFNDHSGIGDFTLPMLFFPHHKEPRRWGFGAGPTFIFPTATKDELGTETWQAGAGGVVTYKGEKFSTGVFGSYWWDYAKSDNDAEGTSHGSLLYWYWYSLPDTWQIGLGPTITYNDKAPSDNKWNVPVGLSVAKMVMFGKLPVKFQLGFEKSIVRQEDYGKDWTLKLNIIPVIPSLQKKPFF